MTTVFRRGTVIASFLALSACQLPDVTPFVDASMEVRSGFAAGGDALRLELEAMETRPDFPRPANADDLHSRKFDALWKVRIQAADAMVAYANSLRAITSAAAGGEASGEALAKSVQSLGEAAGIFPGGRLASGLVADTAKLIVGQIAQIRGYSSLKDSLAASDTAVQGIAGLLSKDLADADGLLQLAVALQLQTMTQALGDNLGFRKKLLDQRQEIYKKTPMTADLEARLTELEKQLQNTESWYQPYQKTQDALRARLRVERRLVAQCGRALEEWAQAHHQLTIAVRDGLGFSVDSLLKTTGEIQDLVKKVQQP